MADEIIKMGGKIIFNSKVNAIDIKDNKIVKLKAKDIGGNILEYNNVKTVFSSMPIKELVKSFEKCAKSRNKKYC